MRCGDCEYATNKEYHSYDDKFQCVCPKMLYGYCYSTADLKPGEVHIEDDEGWGMFVTADFGCVHFKAKG